MYFYEQPNKYWETNGDTHSLGIRFKPEKGRIPAAFVRIKFTNFNPFSKNKEIVDRIIDKLNSGELKESDFKKTERIESLIDRGL